MQAFVRMWGHATGLWAPITRAINGSLQAAG